MAKSKRNRVVPLTKVAKKENLSMKKTQLVEKIESYLKEFEFCYVFRYKNMTTVPMQEVRNYWSSSKFLIGKNKVLQVALGKSEDDEPKSNSHKLSAYLKGNCGLFFSNENPEYVVNYFTNFACPYFGNVGTVSTQTKVLKAGKPEELAEFPPSMESQFRQLGLQIKLEGGRFYLLSDFVVCKQGELLTPEQTKMIKHLGIQMDEFKIYVHAHLSKNGEFVEVLKNDTEMKDDDMVI